MPVHRPLRHLLAAAAALLLAACVTVPEAPQLKAERETHPGAYEAYRRGLSRWEAGDAAGAVAEYERAIAQSPQQGQYYHQRGLARAKLNDAAGAVADATRALELTPDRPDDDFASRFAKGQIYGARAAAQGQLNRPREQLADLELAVRYAPSWIEFRQQRDRVQAQLNPAAPAPAARREAEEPPRRYGAGDNAFHCAMKWGNTVSNSCPQRIRVQTSASRVCTAGSFVIAAKGQVFLNCTDVSAVSITSAVFTGD